MFFLLTSSIEGLQILTSHHLLLIYKPISTWYSADSKTCEMKVFHRIYMLIIYQMWQVSLCQWHLF